MEYIQIKLEDKIFDNIEDLEAYLISNLEHLKASLISASKLRINEIININVTSSNLKECKLENITYKDFNINITVTKKKNNEKLEEGVSNFNLEIKGIKEFGLLLLIPSKYKEKFEIENIRENLFSLWKIICHNLNFSTIEIIKYFRINKKEKK